MAPPHRTTAFLLYVWALILYLPLALAQNPEHSVTYFDNLPARLFFFDDTRVSLSLLAAELLTNVCRA